MGNSGVIVAPSAKPQLFATASLDFPSIGAGAAASLTVAVPGAVVGEAVVLGPPPDLTGALIPFGFVSAADVVTVRLINAELVATIDPPSASWTVAVLKA